MAGTILAVWRYVICFALVAQTLAQSVGFTVYPQQVVTGQTYTVSWDSGGQPATIDLLRGGSKQDTLFTTDGTTSSFQWTVEDDYDGATDYELQLSSGQNNVLASNIYVIEDEDGLVVSGSTITSPSPTAMVTATTGLSSVGASLTTGSNTLSTTSSSRSSSQPTSTATSTPSDTPNLSPAKGLSDGAIAGIVIGVFLIAALAAGAVWLYRRRKLRTTTDADLDPIASFLALGRHGRRPVTIKGTSPEVKAGLEDDREFMVGGREVSELHGDPIAPGPKHNGNTSILTRVFEINRSEYRDMVRGQH